MLVQKLRLSDRRVRIVVGLTAVILFAAGGYALYLALSNGSDDNTIVIEGKTYTKEFYTTRNREDIDPQQINFEPEQVIKELERRLAANPNNASYQDYETLARLHAGLGNTEEAISYYEKTKGALDPHTPDYVALAKEIDDILAGLKKESN